MAKRLYIPVALILLILAVSISIYALWNNRSTSMGASVSSRTMNQMDTSKQNNKTESGEVVTVIGAIECLVPKDTNGTQLDDCALGLTEANGTSYALDAANPLTIGSLPTSQQVQITGTLIHQATQYNAAGIINVTSVERL